MEGRKSLRGVEIRQTTVIRSKVTDPDKHHVSLDAMHRGHATYIVSLLKMHCPNPITRKKLEKTKLRKFYKTSDLYSSTLPISRKPKKGCEIVTNERKL